MQAGSLGEFLTLVEDRRELQRVRSEVHPQFELSEISRRVESIHTPVQPGPVLAFDHVFGSRVPVVTNLLGSSQRAALAFGCLRPEAVAARFAEFLSREFPAGWRARLEEFKRHSLYQQWQPIVVKEGDCQYVVRMGRDVDLTSLPGLQHGRGESGPSFSCAQMTCLDPATGEQVFERFPVFPLDPQHLALRWEVSSPLGRLWERACREDRPLACALVFGGPMALEAVLRWSPFRWHKPLLLASILSQSRTELVKCRTSELHVPSTAEIVLEGTLDPKIAPFGTGAVTNSSGLLLPERDCPIMKIACLTQRSNPVLPASIPHDGISEAQSLNIIWEQLLTIALKSDFPQVVDVHLAQRSSCGEQVFVAIEKSAPFEMRQLLHALWGSTWLSSPRLVIGVDADVPLRDYPWVMKAVAIHANPQRDYLTTSSTSTEYDVEFAPGRPACLMGIDATRKWTGELAAGLKPSIWGAQIPREVGESLAIKWQSLFEM